ncbi:MAG: NnrS family protein [Limisphaerales bacterium]
MNPSRISMRELAAEPFRLFFPLAVLVGLAGVSLWPLHFGGVMKLYPGLSHARLMAYGLFGGFIFGFLGTAMPRMLSVRPFTVLEAFLLVLVYLAMAGAYFFAKIPLGDELFLAVLLCFFGCIAWRFPKRQDTPPPGFILVLLGLLCAAVGAVLAIVASYSDEPPTRPLLQHLLSYQGFVLFPILGVGAFVLPRFFGLPNPHDFPEAKKPSASWMARAWPALLAAALILLSFWLEADGWYRLGSALRFVTSAVYVVFELPLFRRAKIKNAFSLVLKLAFMSMLAGFFFVSVFPQWRVGLLHLTLVGGFAVITFSVATRVIFGHSGNLALMSQPNRWLLWVTGIMWFAMITRISGDFWPKIMASHYIYGAIFWSLGVIWWSWKVLPRIWQRELES